MTRTGARALLMLGIVAMVAAVAVTAPREARPPGKVARGSMPEPRSGLSCSAR